jgi:hypothetical protein
LSDDAEFGFSIAIECVVSLRDGLIWVRGVAARPSYLSLSRQGKVTERKATRLHCSAAETGVNVNGQVKTISCPRRGWERFSTATVFRSEPKTGRG